MNALRFHSRMKHSSVSRVCLFKCIMQLLPITVIDNNYCFRQFDIDNVIDYIQQLLSVLSQIWIWIIDRNDDKALICLDLCQNESSLSLFSSHCLRSDYILTHNKHGFLCGSVVTSQ